MSNIEDDIKIVAKFNKENRFRDCGKLNNAIYNLINSYEEHKKENGELREKVKELEEDIMKKDLEIIGTKEDIEANMKEIIEKYYTANEDYISKQKVKQGLEDIEDYFDRLNGPDEDIEYIRQVKQEILKGESK